MGLLGRSKAAAVALVAGLAVVAILPAFLLGVPWAPPRSTTGPLSSAASASLLHLDGVGPTAAGFSWSRSLDLCFLGYELQYSDSALGPWTTWSTIPNIDALSAYAYGFTPGGTTWWQLVDHACDVSLPSVAIAVTQSSAATLAATPINGTSIAFSWTNDARYGGRLAFGRYDLMESINGEPWTVAATIPDVSTKSDAIGGLGAGVGYSFYLATTDVCDGCTDGSEPSISASNAVTFGTPVALKASMQASRSTTYVDEPVTFTCAASGGSPPFTYGWTFGDGESGSGSTVSHAYTAPGAKTVACTVLDGASNQATASAAVTVSSTPLNVTVLLTTSTPNVDERVVFYAEGRGGAGGYNCTWSFGDGAAASQCSTDHAWTVAGRYTVMVVLSDVDGNRTSDSRGVVVRAALTASVEVTPWPPVAGQVSMLSGHVSGGSGGYNCSWDFGDSSRGDGCSISHVWRAPGTRTVVLAVTDSEGQRFSIATAVSVTSNTTGLLGLPRGEDLIVIAVLVLVAAIYVREWRARRRETLSMAAEESRRIADRSRVTSVPDPDEEDTWI